MMNNKMIYCVAIIFILILICFILSCCWCLNYRIIRKEYVVDTSKYKNKKKKKTRKVTMMYSTKSNKCKDKDIKNKKKLFDKLSKNHDHDDVIFEKQEVQSKLDKCAFVQSQNGTQMRKSLFNTSEHLENFYKKSFPELYE